MLAISMRLSPSQTLYDSGQDGATALPRRQQRMLAMVERQMTSGEVLGEPALQLHTEQPAPE